MLYTCTVTLHDCESAPYIAMHGRYESLIDIEPKHNFPINCNNIDLIAIITYVN